MQQPSKVHCQDLFTVPATMNTPKALLLCPTAYLPWRSWLIGRRRREKEGGGGRPLISLAAFLTFPVCEPESEPWIWVGTQLSETSLPTHPLLRPASLTIKSNGKLLCFLICARKLLTKIYQALWKVLLIQETPTFLTAVSSTLIIGLGVVL